MYVGTCVCNQPCSWTADQATAQGGRPSSQASTHAARQEGSAEAEDGQQPANLRGGGRILLIEMRPARIVR